MMAATKLIIFLFSFCFVLDGGIGRKDSLCDPTIICNKTRDYDIQKPFCGSDGSTYTSICELKTIICKGINVIKLFDGSCQKLDLNSNGVLEQKEYKLFRREIRKWNLFKRCAKNFVSFCDSNGDLKISTKEWEFCTLEASLNISLISIETQSHANPFLHILIPD
uniref:Kazal-like domain-containing protein n=1 Tax=Rhabditophanes sp. KR3021 TaxID=114890 RepID=A0AC35U8I2_9BILA